RLNGDLAGTVEVTSSDGEVKVKLGSLLELVSSAMPQQEYLQLAAMAAADNFVSIDALKANDLKVGYDPVYDEVKLEGQIEVRGTPTKAYVDQIAPIEGGPSRTMMEQID
ncbi:MAG: hypothetical protein V2J14_05705, partial [Erythrobacter sp.]|nr:hypothetical protein [Erythrobacter sp.]